MEKSEVYGHIEALFFDWFFKGEEGHSDWTDEQISLSVNKDDIDKFLAKIKETVYDEFNITEEGE